MSRKWASRSPRPRRDPVSLMRRTERFPQDAEPVSKEIKRILITTAAVLAGMLIAFALYAALLQWALSS